MAEPLLESNFAPEVYYQNFEKFLEGHFGMMRRYGMSYTPVYMLIRLARNDLEKARSVLDWAVKRVCCNMLNDPERFRPVATEISTDGLKWATHAVDTFGRNPLRSIGLIEGVYLLERMRIWAEEKFQDQFGGKRSLLEFRKRPLSNEEADGKMGWIDLFYQQARSRALEDSEHFVRRRDCAIMLAITALADGVNVSDAEIDDAMSYDFPTHQSLAKLIQDSARGNEPGSLVNQNFVVEWVLGPHQREVTF